MRIHRLPAVPRRASSVSFRFSRWGIALWWGGGPYHLRLCSGRVGVSREYALGGCSSARRWCVCAVAVQLPCRGVVMWWVWVVVEECLLGRRAVIAA
jgi:hypothetical protein